MSLRDESTLIISSCDKFSDLWGVYFSLFQQNWKCHPNETILVTDVATERRFNDVTVFAAGSNHEMPARLKDALKNIRTEYIFLTLDDYFIYNPINDTELEEVFSFIKEKDIDYFRLSSFPNKGTPIKEHKGWKWINLNTNYAVNLYPGIWKKTFLDNVLVGNLSPWQFEVTLTNHAKRDGAICVMSRKQEFPILDVVRKGKVLHKAKRFLDKNQLYIGNRPVLPYWTEVKLSIIGLGSQIIPTHLAKMVRKILHVFGMSFFSDGTRKQ